MNAGSQRPLYFNPHHPQGGDKKRYEKSRYYGDFNPHHPQGGDTSVAGLPELPEISIHTTRKVVTYRT